MVQGQVSSIHKANAKVSGRVTAFEGKRQTIFINKIEDISSANYLKKLEISSKY